MTEAELREKLSNEVFSSFGFLSLAFLPDLPMNPTRLAVSFSPAKLSWETVVGAVANLNNIPPEFRATVEQEIFRFYLQEIEDGSADFESAQAQLDYEREQGGPFSNPVAAVSPADVWPLVKFEKLLVTTGISGEVIMRVEGKAAWDGEHGIVLTFSGKGALKFVSGWGRWA